MNFRTILISTLTSILIISCCGCSLLEHKYEKRTVYTSALEEYEILSATDVFELFEILRAAVDRYAKTADVFLIDYNGDVVNDIQLCIDRICNTYPLGRFAVEKIGRSIECPGDMYSVHFNFTYKASDSEVLNMMTLSSEDGISHLISAGLQSYINRFIFKTAYNLTNKSKVYETVNNILSEYPYFSIALNDYNVDCYADPEFNSVYLIQFYYAYSKNILAEFSGEIKALADTFSKLYTNVSPYEKIYRIFTYLTESAAPFTEGTEISFDSALLSCAYGPLVKGLGDSSGYAEAFKILADSVGIDCVIVYGQLFGAAHAWNLVDIDGGWYHSDALMGENYPSRLCFHNAVVKGYSWSPPENASYYYGKSINADDIYAYMQAIK